MAAQISVMTGNRDRRSEAALLPAEQAVPVAHDQAAKRERRDHDTGQCGERPGPPVGQADDVTTDAAALARKSGLMQRTSWSSEAYCWT